MSKHVITDPEEILATLLDDPAFTEAANRDIRGVYLVGGDGSKRYINQLEMEDGPQRILVKWHAIAVMIGGENLMRANSKPTNVQEGK